jgi:hypothetical protein
VLARQFPVLHRICNFRYQQTLHTGTIEGAISNFEVMQNHSMTIVCQVHDVTMMIARPSIPSFRQSPCIRPTSTTSLYYASIKMKLIASFDPSRLCASAGASAFVTCRSRDRCFHCHSTQLFFGGPKDDGSPAITSADCGYVFTKGPAKGRPPPMITRASCGAIKRRFKKVPKGSEGGKVR